MLLCISTDTFLFNFLCFIVPITPLPSTPSPSPPSLQRLPSLKNSKKATNPTSPPVPKKGTLDPGSSDKPSESVPLSPVNSEGIGAGETQEGPIKPKRSAPPPPLSGKLAHVTGSISTVRPALSCNNNNNIQFENTLSELFVVGNNTMIFP